MIRAEQVIRLSNSLEESIFALIDKNMELQQQIVILKSQNLDRIPKSVLSDRSKEYQRLIQQKETEITVKQLAIAQLQTELNTIKVKIAKQEQEDVDHKARLKQMAQLQIQSANIAHNLQIQNNSLKSEIFVLKQKLQQLEIHNESVMQISNIMRNESIVQPQQNQLKDIKLCSDCKANTYMIFYNKEKKNRQLKQENQRLNSYIGEITEDPKYSNNIKKKLSFSQIQGNLNHYQKDVIKQLHYYKLGSNDQKDKVINNLNTLLRNFKKEINGLILQGSNQK